MTVQNMTVKNVYEGNGSATVFPYTFALSPEDGEHINVYVTDENNISRRVTNFTVDTTAKTVKYPIGGDPLPAGKRLTLRREIPAQQELNLENQGAFFAEDVESQFDRNVMMIQQLAETLQRAIVVDVASDKKPEDLLTEILSNLKDAVAAMNRAVAAANASEASAERSTQEAGNSEASAKRSAGSAATSEQMAASATSSEKAAAASADTAKTWAGAAEESAKKALARESAASTSAEAAKTWAGKAEESAGKAQASAVTATEQSGKAQDSEAHAATSKTDANKSAVEAKLAAEEAASAAEKAKQIAGGNFATPKQVDEKIAALVNQAPETLNTLSEIAAALGNDPNFATTITALVGKKLGKTEVAAGAERLTISGKLGAELKAGVGILVLNRVGNSTNFEMVPTPRKNVTVGTAENCTGNAATATTAGTAAQASVAHSVPGSDVGGNIWIA